MIIQQLENLAGLAPECWPALVIHSSSAWGMTVFSASLPPLS